MGSSPLARAAEWHERDKGDNLPRNLNHGKTMSKASKKNQAAESRLVDDSKIEARAVQIARDEGRDSVTADDRARAREELYAPNETEGDAEVTPEMGVGRVTAWDEAPGDSGRQVPRVKPEDETAADQELVEKGLRAPAPPQG
jgi:hypothetical protein